MGYLSMSIKGLLLGQGKDVTTTYELKKEKGDYITFCFLKQNPVTTK